MTKTPGCAARLAALAGVVLLAGCASRPPTEASAERSEGAAPAGPVDQRVPVQVRREQAIAAYLEYLERYPATPEANQIRRRVADLMVDSAAELAASAAVDPGSADRVKAQQRYAAAIGFYEGLLREDPRAHDDTALLYQLARAYEEHGQPERAMRVLDRLIADTEAADPRLYADAQFRRGEILFGAGAYAQAEDAYRAVVGQGEAVAVFEQALYKLGWDLFKQARYREALEVFVSLLDRKLLPAEPLAVQLEALSRAEREQVGDVLRAVVLCFSYLEGAESVAAHFRRVGARSYEARTYRDLAELYTDKELFTEAAVTYLALAGRAPLAEEAPGLVIEAIGRYRQAGLQGKVLDTQAAFVEGYGMNSAFWEGHSPQGSPEIQATLRASLVELAAHSHARAQTSGAESDFAAAARWYRDYLAWFKAGPERLEMRFGLAALLYEQGQYAQAAIEFDGLAYGPEPHPRGAEAGLRALLAYEKLGAPSGTAGASAAQQTASAIRFAETYGGHPEAAAVFARAGVALLERGDPQTAVKVAEAVLQTAPPSAEALRRAAWSVLGQGHYALGDFRGAELAYREALGLTPSAERRNGELASGVASAIYRQAELQRDRGGLSEAAVLFQRAAQAAPDAAAATAARYDAASAWLAAEQWPPAITALEALRRAKPAPPFRDEATRKLAFAYERSGRHAVAAALYAELGQGRGEARMRRAALVRAADLYLRVGERHQARDMLERYAREFPEPPAEAIEVFQRLAELEADAGNLGRRRHWLEQVVAADRAAASARTERTRRLAAQATLALAQSDLAAFRRVRLIEPLQSNLERKLRAMEQALARLEAAARFQVDEVTVVATDAMIDLYQELAGAIRGSQRPAGLNREEQAQYERLLDEQAAAFERKAEEINEQRLRGATEGPAERREDASAARVGALRGAPVTPDG